MLSNGIIVVSLEISPMIDVVISEESTEKGVKQKKLVFHNGKRYKMNMTEEMKKAQRKRLKITRKKRQLKEKRFWEKIIENNRQFNREDKYTQTPELFDAEFLQFALEDVTFETLGEIFDELDIPNY